MKKAAPSILFWLLLLSFRPTVFAQQEDSDTLITNDLQTVTVTAYRLETTDLETPLSITRINERQLQTGTQQLALDEALANIPGVFVQNGTNFAQDIRISIRGFGARSAFGIRGIKILVDGFPESTPDGTAQVDAIDPSALTGIDVIRSGTGGLYGNASGGYINFNTMRFVEKQWGEMSSTIGGYGFHKSQLRLGGSLTNKFLYSLNSSYVALEGYREHSAMRNFLLNGGFLAPIDSSLSIRGVFTFVNSPLAQDPGGLNAKQIIQDRTSPGNNYEYYDAGENLWQVRMGIGLIKKFSKQHRINTSFFQTNRSFNSNLINDIVQFQRSYTGGSFSYQFETKPNTVNWQFTAGIDLEKQTDDRSRFENNGGERGDQYAYGTETFGSLGIFLVQKLELGQHFTLLPAFRYDAVRIASDDKTPNSLPDLDLVDSYHSLNPSIGFSIMLAPGFHLFTNFNKNFETPTLLEISQSANKQLKPQKSKSIEIGYKIAMANGKIRFEPSIFKIKLKDEIILYRPDLSSNSQYDNIGKSTRLGLEAILSGQFSKNIYANINYTHSNFTINEYGDFRDKITPGIPNNVLGMSVVYSFPNGISLTYGNTRVGRIYSYYDNENKIKPYWNGYLKFDYSFSLKVIQMSLFGGANNLYNKWFNANVRIDASKPYEPAPLRNYYVGAKFKF
ncbi:MAG: TonB-dependent receptor plug domain-containing protein [Bacteroidetes bacterium]|nr:TonB-dependent receptor plug domain-containing protein [Bacteroidota bacterium]